MTDNESALKLLEGRIINMDLADDKLPSEPLEKLPNSIEGVIKEFNILGYEKETNLVCNEKGLEYGQKYNAKSLSFKKGDTAIRIYYDDRIKLRISKFTSFTDEQINFSWDRYDTFYLREWQLVNCVLRLWKVGI